MSLEQPESEPGHRGTAYRTGVREEHGACSGRTLRCCSAASCSAAPDLHAILPAEWGLTSHDVWPPANSTALNILVLTSGIMSPCLVSTFLFCVSRISHPSDSVHALEDRKTTGFCQKDLTNGRGKNLTEDLEEQDLNNMPSHILCGGGHCKKVLLFQNDRIYLTITQDPKKQREVLQREGGACRFGAGGGRQGLLQILCQSPHTQCAGERLPLSPGGMRGQQGRTTLTGTDFILFCSP